MKRMLIRLVVATIALLLAGGIAARPVPVRSAPACDPAFTMLNDRDAARWNDWATGVRGAPFVRAQPRTAAAQLVWFRVTFPRIASGAYLVAPTGVTDALLFDAPGLADGGRRYFDRGRPYVARFERVGPPVVAVPAWESGHTAFLLGWRETAGGVGCPVLRDARQFASETGDRWPITLYLGVLATLALYNALLALATRESSPAFYAAYLAALTSYQCLRWNYGWAVAWPDVAWHAGEFEYFAFAFTLALHALFTRALLQLRRCLPVADRALLTIALLTASYAFVNYAVGVRFGISIGYGIVVLFVAQVASALAAGIARARAGDRAAQFFVVSYPLLFIFVGFALVRWITGSASFLGLYGAELGTLAECIALSLAVGDRLRSERRLRSVVSELTDAVVRVDRTGRLTFVSPNLTAHLGITPGAVPGRLAQCFVSPESDGAVHSLVRAALRGGRGTPVALLLRGADGTPVAVDALACALRDDHSTRIRELQIVLRDARTRREADAQLERAAQAPPPAPATTPVESTTDAVHVSVFAATIRRADGERPVKGRELELLAALALHADPYPGPTLAALLWPDDDGKAAINKLNVTLSRLRGTLGSKGAIAAGRGGYQLAASVTVDVRQLQGAVTRHHADYAAVIARLRIEIARPLPEGLVRREWFEPFAPMLERLRRELFARLGTEAIVRGRTADALALAEDLIRLDAADETGYALAMRAHLTTGDVSAARRAYRDCERAVEAEYNVAPSADLRRLLATAATPSQN